MRSLTVAAFIVIMLAAVLAAPALAQTYPPTPTNVAATTNSASTMTVTWTAIPSSGCSGSVDYFVRAASSSQRFEIFTAIGATSHVISEVTPGTFSIEVYSYCYATDEYSQSPGMASVTISASITATPVPTVDDSLGVAQVAGVSASASGNTIVVNWTNAAGQTAPSGYCDVMDYLVKVDNNTNAEVANSGYIVAGTWTSGSLSAGTYEVGITAYSSECDEWSPFVYAYVTIG